MGMLMSKMGRSVACWGLALLAGCGGGDSQSSSPTSTGTTSLQRQAAASDQPPANRMLLTAAGTPVDTSAPPQDGVMTKTGLRFGRFNKPIQIPSTRPDAPASTWQAPADAILETGNALYIESNGQGQQFVPVVSMGARSTELSIRTDAPAWIGKLLAPRGMSKWQTGYYESIRPYPGSTIVNHSMDWRSDVHGCSSPVGWVAMDNVVYNANRLVAIDLRFEQSCATDGWIVRGRLRWTDPDAGTVRPIPADLWQPPAGSTPTSGNYVYLQSDADDYVGQGRTYLHTQANSVLIVALTGGYLGVSVNGAQWWTGDFKAMEGVNPLQVGLYPDLHRYPFHDPLWGGVSWSGDGRGCNVLTGWFAVDNLTIVNGVMTAVDLRFEQHCEGDASALRGKIHWRNDDTTAPPGPQLPMPDQLWKPAAGIVPASGNVAYMESAIGDWVGAGATWLYTPSNASFRLSRSGKAVLIDVTPVNTWWNGSFEPMETIDRLQVGYYPNASRFPFNNPTAPGLDWTGDGRGCNVSTGWFAVDAITYSGDQVTSLDIRFEQFCDGSTRPLRGRVRWSSN